LDEIRNALAFEEAADHILAHAEEYDVAELILPMRGKPYFERCAYILSRMPVDFIAGHAVELLEWFQDLNWPGIDSIYTALHRLTQADIAVAVNKALEMARIANDEEWAYNLCEKFGDYIE